MEHASKQTLLTLKNYTQTPAQLGATKLIFLISSPAVTPLPSLPLAPPFSLAPPLFHLLYLILVLLYHHYHHPLLILVFFFLFLSLLAVATVIVTVVGDGVVYGEACGAGGSSG